MAIKAKLSWPILSLAVASLLLSGCISTPDLPHTTEMTIPTFSQAAAAPRAVANLAALAFLFLTGLAIIATIAFTHVVPIKAILATAVSATLIALLPELVDLTGMTLKYGLAGVSIAGLAFFGAKVLRAHKAERK